MRISIERKNWFHKSLSEVALEKKLQDAQEAIRAQLFDRVRERATVAFATEVMEALIADLDPKQKLDAIRDLCGKHVVVVQCHDD